MKAYFVELLYSIHWITQLKYSSFAHQAMDIMKNTNAVQHYLFQCQLPPTSLNHMHCLVVNCTTQPHKAWLVDAVPIHESLV